MLKITEEGRQYVGSPEFLEEVRKKVRPLVEAGMPEGFCTTFLMALAVNALVSGPTGPPLTLPQVAQVWSENSDEVTAAFKRCRESSALFYGQLASATIQ